MRINPGRAVTAGIVGTLAMTAVGLYVAPMMGVPRMNPAWMLAGAMGGIAVAGWIAHIMIGIVLAFGYAVIAPFIPGAPPARGAIYGIAPYLVAQIVVIPMMGMPLFSGSAPMAIGSLAGHIIYGAVVGAVYGSVVTVSARSASPRSATAH